MPNDQQPANNSLPSHPSLTGVPQAPKLRAAILFFVTKIKNKLDRVKLCKHLYFADGHYYQKYQEAITEFPYLHIEGSPQPMHFNEVLHRMIEAGEVEVIPNVVTQTTEDIPILVLKGLSYSACVDVPGDVFSREEKKVLNSVASLFNGDLSLETRYYPNLYQQYAQTDLYKEIPFTEFPDGKRPHLSWKAWANKVFRLMLE